ncbi:MAG: aldo/keto reductase [Candidatus Pelagibacter sp. TMED273]|nr:MAG: aldo/keto reductase [Candidatus Pelagibacter sp. TMED273]
MRYNYLGTTKIKLSIIGLGTMTFGEQNSQTESYSLMDYAFERGVNFFDTAEMYPIYPKEETSGDSERILGNWIKNNKLRDKVIIGTKIASKNEGGIGATKLKWIRKGGENLTFSKNNIFKAVDKSLKRLQTDYIDLYQLHWPERKVGMFGKLDFEYDSLDTWTPFLEVLDSLEELIKIGKIRHIGLSNETPWGVMKFLEYSRENKQPRIMTVQNAYSLVNRVFDIANSEVAIREKCGLLAYSPIAGGRLSGKYINNARPEKTRYSMWPGRFSRHLTHRGEIAVSKYVKLAKKYNIKPSTFAHAFVISRPFVTSSIMGATSIENLKENLNCLNVNLTKEILDEINEIHLLDPNPCV